MFSMLSAHHWITVLAVISALVTYACGSCSWHIDVVRSEFPYLFEPIVQNKLNHIQKDWEDVTIRSFPDEVKPCIYPYFVRVQVECNGIPSTSMMEALLSAGSYPKITISFGALQDQGHSYHTWTDYVFEGALIDTDSDCNVGLCRPVWLAPLPTNEKYLIIHVGVETVGLVNAVSVCRRMITLDGYSQRVHANSSYVASRIGVDADLSELGLFENEIHPVIPVHTVRGITPIQAMAGFVRRSIALISSDFFQHFRVVEIGLGDVAPNCLSGPPIKEAATFPDRIILSTAWGLFEMFADNYSSTKEADVATYRHIELEQCVHHLIVPPHGRQGQRFLSVGQDGKKLYIASLEFGVPTELNEVVDSSGNGPCDHIGQASCTIIDATFGNVDMRATYVLLMTAGDQVILTQYHLLKNDGHGQWDMITSLDANFNIPKAASGIDRDWINVSGLGGCASEESETDRDATCMTLSLTGLSFSGYVSKHLFFWGNTILHSPDNGLTVFVLLEYTSQAAISLFVVGKDSSFALLNTDQEIWYGEIGDNVYLKKLRPSPGWGRMLRLTGQELEDPSFNSITISIFFDSWGTLYELIAFGNSNQTNLKRRRIDQGEILANSVYSFAMEELQHEHEEESHDEEEEHEEESHDEEEEHEEESHDEEEEESHDEEEEHEEESHDEEEEESHDEEEEHEEESHDEEEESHDEEEEHEEESHDEEEEESHDGDEEEGEEHDEGSVSPLLDYECPYSQVNFENLGSFSFERRERYVLGAPQLVDSDKHTEKSLMIYQAIVHHLLSEKEDHQTIRDNEIAEASHNPFRKWYRETETLHNFNHYLYQNLQSGIHIDNGAYYLQPFENTPDDTRTLPSTIYLDKNEVFEFAISLELGLTHSNVEIEDLHALIQVSNDDVLGIDTQFFEYRLNSSIRYEVVLSDKGALELQAGPGVDLYPASMLIHVWHSTFSCFIKEGDIFKPEGIYTMDVMLGCPPGRKLVFDLQLSIDVLQKRFYYDCPVKTDNRPCLHYHDAFRPMFKVVDFTTGEASLFTGLYTLTVIGGSPSSAEDITRFTPKEQVKYNNLGIPGARIWQPIRREGVINDSIPVYSHHNNTIKWICQAGSPCANVPPSKLMRSPEYFFLIEMSNLGVDTDSTYCHYDLQFIVHVHGMDIGSKSAIIIVAWSFVVTILVVCLFIACDYKDRRLWKRFKASCRRCGADPTRRVVPVSSDSSEEIELEVHYREGLDHRPVGVSTTSTVIERLVKNDEDYYGLPPDDYDELENTANMDSRHRMSNLHHRSVSASILDRSKT